MRRVVLRAILLTGVVFASIGCTSYMPPPVASAVPLPGREYYKGLSESLLAHSGEGFIDAYALDPRFPDLFAAFGLNTSVTIEVAAVHNGESDVALYRFVPSKAQGRVLIATGLSHHVGYEYKIINELLLLDLEVWCFDLPGQGLSGGKYSYVSDFKYYAETVRAITTLFDTELPTWAVGHSTGCSALMRYLLEYPDEARSIFREMILYAPLVRPILWPVSSVAYAGLKDVLPVLPALNRNTSHDPYFMWLKSNDPFRLAGLAVAWVGALRENIKLFETHHPLENSVPLVLVQGTSDSVVEWKQNIPVIERLFDAVETVYIKGAFHDLLIESPEYFTQVMEPLRSLISRSLGM